MGGCASNPSMKSSAVSSEKLDTLLPLGWAGCQGRPFFGRSSRPLTACPTPTYMERGTKRNEVQLSFVPWQKDFAFAFCRVPFARLDEFQTGGKNRQTSRSSSQLSVRRVKALVHRGLKVPPGNWFAPPGSNRSGSGGNEAAGASDVEGRFRRLGESCRP